VDFEDNTEEQSVVFGSKPDPTFDYGSLSGIYDLKDWFSRPIPIKSFNWNQGFTLDFSMNPWWDYFGTTTVKNKLLGYSRLRCNLHVKLVINSTPFAYSMGLMSYRPLGDDLKPGTSFSGGNIDTSGGDSVLMARTQRPSCYFNPQDQRGCTMQLPFIKQDNWITLSESPFCPPSLQTEPQLRNMGTLNFNSFTPLLMSNDSTGQAVEITIFAWATDVELMGPSAAFQSGVADEVGTTPISDIATGAAAAAGDLENVPAVAPYAKATSMVMSGVSAVAKALGYSKPINIAPIAPYRYLTNPSVANSSVPVPSDVLAIDPKAELTIDPRTVCAGDSDPNLISDIIQKDSYWFTASWQVADPTNTEICRFAVTPEVFRNETRTGTGSGGAYWVRQCSPMCHVAQCFGYWQGDIVYTFRFISSKFHRGRVRIFYEPEQLGDPLLDSGYNINHVVDLGSTTTFEMRVPYMRPTPWAKVAHLATRPGININYRVRSSGTAIAYDRETMNGLITMTVLNDLSAPSTSADISVLVSARAADNFSFAQPKTVTPLNEAEMATVFAGSGDYAGPVSYGDIASFQSGHQDEPEQNHEMAISIPAPVPTMDPYVFMGEKITSLKQLFARVCYYTHVAAEDAKEFSYGQACATLTQPRFPRQYGPDSAGLNNHSLPGPENNYGYNFVGHSFLSWFVPAFIGWRGSVVWRIQPFISAANYFGRAIQDTSQISAGCNVERFPVQTFYRRNTVSGNENLNGITAEVQQMAQPDSAGELAYFFSQKFSFMNGASAAAPSMEPVNVAAVPMYSAFRMHPANPKLLSVPSTEIGDGLSRPVSYDTDYGSDNVRFTAWGYNFLHGGSHFVNPFALYVAGGDDFTPFMYLNAPTFYVGSKPGSPAGPGYQKAADYGVY